MSETETHTEAPDTSDETLESVARSAGWKPESEWKGDPPPGGFLPPAQFLKAQKTKADSLSRELSQFRKETDRRIERMERQSKAQREREMADLHREYDLYIKAAAKAGDDTEYERLIAEKATLDEQDDDAPQDEETIIKGFVEAFEPSYPRLQKTFFDEGHAWLLDDDADPDAMRIYIDAMSADGPFADNLERAEKALRRAYPESYADEEKPEERPQRRVPVLSPGGRGSRTDSYSARLTPAQREIAQRCVKDGLYGSVEEWAEVRFKGES